MIATTASTMRPRPYQERAIESVLHEFTKVDSTMVCMATGLGKTILFASVVDRMMKKGQCVVLAHRRELIQQAADKIARVTGIMPDIEMAEQRVDHFGMFGPPKIIVSSIQTQVAGPYGGRMTKVNPDDVSLLVIDECHHAVSPAYRQAIEHYRRNPDCKVLGVTATADRGDKRALGRVFDSVAYRYDILDGIRDGWLVPIRQEFVDCQSLDFSHIRIVAGDLSKTDLARVLEYEQALQEVAVPTVEIAGDRKTLVFAASVKQAERMAEIINRMRPGKAAFVCAVTPEDERRDIVGRFADGQIQFLCNVGVFTEGFDDPGVQVVAVARPTRSRALYAQMVGRGTRTLPDVVDGIPESGDRKVAIAGSDKPDVTVLDFVGNSGRHSLMSTADLLGGDYTDEEREMARERAMAAGKAVSMDDELEAAREVIRQKALAALDAKRRRELQGKAKYSRYEVDPFNPADLDGGAESPKRKPAPASERQVEVLRNVGIKDPHTLTRKQASAVLEQVKDRRAKGLCTYKQEQILKRYGYENAGTITFARASELIDGLAANGWRRPK